MSHFGITFFHTFYQHVLSHSVPHYHIIFFSFSISVSTFIPTNLHPHLLSFSLFLVTYKYLLHSPNSASSPSISSLFHYLSQVFFIPHRNHFSSYPIPLSTILNAFQLSDFPLPPSSFIAITSLSSPFLTFPPSHYLTSKPR